VNSAVVNQAECTIEDASALVSHCLTFQIEQPDGFSDVAMAFSKKELEGIFIDYMLNKVKWEVHWHVNGSDSQSREQVRAAVELQLYEDQAMIIED
jgi:hypothetical protein